LLAHGISSKVTVVGFGSRRANVGRHTGTAIHMSLTNGTTQCTYTTYRTHMQIFVCDGCGLYIFVLESATNGEICPW
jgi:hypothetical protein